MIMHKGMLERKEGMDKKDLEKLWADTIDENKENRVDMPIYGDDSQRPTDFFVQYRINDRK